MSDILVECDKVSLESMLNILEAHLPQRIQQYNLIYNFLYHYDKIHTNRDKIYSDRWNIRFFTPRSGKPENCTLVYMTGSRDYILIYFTLQESGAELKECLLKTEMINWHNKLLAMACDESLFEVVQEVARQKVDIDWETLPIENIMHITKKKIAELPLERNLADYLYVAPLSHEDHAKIINDHWDYKDANSLDLIHQSLELNGGVGLFRRGEKQPISWILTNEFFTPGCLYTLKPERRRGYGLLMMKLELKRLLKIHDLDLFTFVTELNEASMGLHRKLGFETVCRIIWIEKPNICN